MKEEDFNEFHPKNPKNILDNACKLPSYNKIDSLRQQKMTLENIFDLDKNMIISL